MAYGLDTLTYERWVRHVFDRQVAKPEWYWDPAAEKWQPEPAQCVELLTHLFNDSEAALAPYSDLQLNQGFWYLASADCSDYMFSLTEKQVPWAVRRSCIRSIATLFDTLFAKRCSDQLGHLDEQPATPLNLVCYMWWDLVPIHGRPEDPDCVELDEELLRAMTRILTLRSIACQESALHGLGHWHLSYPTYVTRTIDEFLARTHNIRPELLQYAQSAREGCVL